MPRSIVLKRGVESLRRGYYRGLAQAIETVEGELGMNTETIMNEVELRWGGGSRDGRYFRSFGVGHFRLWSQWLKRRIRKSL